MSNETINIAVTINVSAGLPSFSYFPDGPIIVSEATDVVFTLTDCSPALSFDAPLISYVPTNASRDINAVVSLDAQTLTLSDTDADSETIGVQLVVVDAYGNAYASPDPRIINKD
tara:strand:+ start:288 stop:632 length:345 start_codon:yes stop_codon:yes gene_type:complete